MKWVSYTRSISSRIGEENPSNTIAEQNERIARYLKKRGCSISEKYSDRKRTAEATEGFDKLVQDGMARKFDAVVVDSIFRCGRTLPFAIEALQRTFYPLGIQFAVVEDDFCSADKTAEEVAEYFNGKTIDKIRSEFMQAAHIDRVLDLNPEKVKQCMDAGLLQYRKKANEIVARLMVKDDERAAVYREFSPFHQDERKLYPVSDSGSRRTAVALI